MKTAAIIEARLSSTRLPGKIMMPILDRPALGHLLDRLKKCAQLDDIIVATTDTPCDVVLADFAEREGVKAYRGSETDVMSRVLEAAQANDVDIIVEITSDCPLADPVMVDDAVTRFKTEEVDYLSNTLKRTFPRGMDIQVFTRAALEQASAATTDPVDREHVSLYIYEHPETFHLAHMGCEDTGLDMPDQRVTLDTPEDYFVIRAVFEALHTADPDFGYPEIHAFLVENPEIAAMNRQIVQKRARAYDFTAKARAALGLDD